MITKGIPKRSDTIQVASFLDIFKFNPIIIPNNYQREYTWSFKKKNTKSALEIFLNDFVDAYNKGFEYKLIFGNNVCIASDERNDIFDLSDGQQRVTTIFIFGLFLCSLINNPKYKESFFLISTERQHELRLQHSLSNWNDAFRNTLLSLDGDEDLLIPIIKAFDQIKSFLDTDSIKTIFNAEKFYKFLMYNVYINVQYISLCDETQYFEDVNTKGVSLDSIASHKFEFVGTNSKLLLLWQECVKQVDLLNTVFISNSTNTLLETVISWVCFIHGLSDKFSGATALFKIKNKTDEEKEKILNTMYTLTTIGYNSFNDDDFKMLRYINKGNYIVAFYILHKIFKYEKKTAINYLIFKYLTSNVGEKASSLSFYKDLKQNGISTELVDASIMDKFIYSKGPNKAIRAILCIVESVFNKDILLKDISAKNYTLEHISSQQFKEVNCNSIGNLTLLTKSENSKLNKLQEKHSVYKNSEFYITRCLCSDYIPIDDEARMFRSKYYGKGYLSQEIDAFNISNFIERQRNLLKSLIKALNLENFITVL